VADVRVDEAVTLNRLSSGQSIQSERQQVCKSQKGNTHNLKLHSDYGVKIV
jgi:hypothetical protein